MTKTNIFRLPAICSVLFLAFQMSPFESFAQTDQTVTYASNFGGVLLEDPRDMQVMPNGNTVICGSTSSFNLDVIDPFQSSYAGGGSDAFISIFDTEGDLVYSSFLGGSDTDIIMSTAVKSDGGYIVVGSTRSDDFPISEGAFQSNFGSVRSGFLSSFSPDHELLWSTYFGGEGQSAIGLIVLDEEMNIYVAGGSSSANISTPGVHQEDPDPDGSSLFLAKFNSSGERIWCTYLYGNSVDVFNSMDISPEGETIYVGGRTFSSDGIAYNAHQNNYGGDSDGLISAFNSEDGTLFWATYYGSSGSDNVNEITVGDEGNIYVSGETTSTENISTPGTHQLDLEGPSDAFMACFAPDGARLWGTYFGGEENEGGGDLVVSGNEITWLGGTNSLNGIATSNALEIENNHPISSFSSRYIAKIDATDGTQIWGSYLFSECPVVGLRGIARDVNGRLILAGITFQEVNQCPNLPTENAYQPNYGGGETDVFLTFIQDNTLSTSQVKYSPLSVYPNPATDEVLVELPQDHSGLMHLQVFDLSGRVVLELPQFASGGSMQIQTLTPGIYILKGESEGKLFREKLVVAR
jgi:hypothetical protein